MLPLTAKHMLDRFRRIGANRKKPLPEKKDAKMLQKPVRDERKGLRR